MQETRQKEAEAALQAYIAGDKAAFDRIVEAHEASLLRFATRMLGDKSAAQDVVQETFIRLLKAARSMRDTGGLTAWLYRTCRNLAIDEMRREKKVEPTALPPEAPLAENGPSVAAMVEKKELFKTVHARMQKLTPNQRSCIVLKILEGKSYKEISAITGLSVSNVGFQIHDGLKRLSAFVGGTRKGGGRDDM